MFNRYVNAIVFKRRNEHIYTVRARLRWKYFKELPREAPSEDDCDWAIVDPAAPNWEFQFVNGVKSILFLPQALWTLVRIPSRVNRWTEALIISLIASLVATWIIWRYNLFQ